jgi:hypothetical protein
MIRRSFLQLLGMAPIVAPTAVSAGLSDTHIDFASYGVGPNAKEPDLAYIDSELGEAREQLAKVGTEFWRQQHHMGHLVHPPKYLDPDLQAMRSFSGVTKLRMQRERNLQRVMEVEKFNGEYRLDLWVKRRAQAILGL